MFTISLAKVFSNKKYIQELYTRIIYKKYVDSRVRESRNVYPVLRPRDNTLINGDGTGELGVLSFIHLQVTGRSSDGNLRVRC